MIIFEYVEEGLIANVHYESHKRGRNWISKLEGKNSVQFTRTCIASKCKKYALVDQIRVGDAIEMGGDYISSGGNRQTDRGYYLVCAIDALGVHVEPYATVAKLLKAKNSLSKQEASV